MVLEQSKFDSPVPLESVLCTEELSRRPARQPDLGALAGALVTLSQALANSPERTLQKLAETALDLCRAHSSGISLLEEENGRKIFRWHAVAGEYAPHLWGTTPREFSPCGTVLDTDAVQLMTHLDRHFTYFAQVQPRISEALLVPFHVGGEAVGTIWVVSHNQTRQFDAADARVMTTLGEFAAGAYQALSRMLALKAILATIREPLLVLDGTLRVQMANQSFYDMFQLTQSVTEGRLLQELGEGEWDMSDLRALLEDVLPKEQIIENFEISQHFHQLGRRVMLLNARKLRREDNPAGLILLAIEDITTRKHTEEELLRSQQDLQRFAFVAAHDLGAPLRSSMALLELLERRTQEMMEPGDRHLLSLARTNLERLQGLMSDILTYSQLGEAESTTLVPLQESLQRALTHLQSEIEEAGAQVECGALPSLMADPSLIMLVFQNLLSNALKYRAPAVPHIRVEGNLDNGEWIVSVADNGQGFDPAYAEMIFQPFKRLPSTSTPGSGIGLTTCKRIVERLGGRIWAESVLGRGATFYFTLPNPRIRDGGTKC